MNVFCSCKGIPGCRTYLLSRNCRTFFSTVIASGTPGDVMLYLNQLNESNMASARIYRSFWPLCLGLLTSDSSLTAVLEDIWEVISTPSIIHHDYKCMIGRLLPPVSNLSSLLIGTRNYSTMKLLLEKNRVITLYFKFFLLGLRARLKLINKQLSEEPPAFLQVMFRPANVSQPSTIWYLSDRSFENMSTLIAVVNSECNCQRQNY